ncbi:MAG: hypothetical protein ACI9U2_003488 [Bradymonadia bacterium]|jgi:hypothetical protein
MRRSPTRRMLILSLCLACDDGAIAEASQTEVLLGAAAETTVEIDLL